MLSNIEGNTRLSYYKYAYDNQTIPRLVTIYKGAFEKIPRDIEDYLNEYYEFRSRYENLRLFVSEFEKIKLADNEVKEEIISFDAYMKLTNINPLQVGIDDIFDRLEPTFIAPLIVYGSYAKVYPNAVNLKRYIEKSSELDGESIHICFHALKHLGFLIPYKPKPQQDDDGDDGQKKETRQN